MCVVEGGGEYQQPPAAHIVVVRKFLFFDLYITFPYEGETYFICEGSVDVSTILPKVGSDHHDKVTEGVHVELCSKKKGQLLNLAVTVGKALDAARYPDDAHRRQAKTLCHKIETTEMICTSDQCDLYVLTSSSCVQSSRKVVI
jgi:hypothetical protein